MYKILSLDGGGAWSIIQLKALQKIALQKSENGSDPDDAIKFLSNFDLIIANSGGSLALAALITFKSFSKSIDQFSDPVLRKKVFNIRPTSIKGGIFKYIFSGPRYSAEKKREGIKNILNGSNIYLTEIPNSVNWDKTHIVICSFDYERERATFFRSNIQSKANSHIISGKGIFKDISLADAVHCASNAPVQFFDKPAYADFSDNTKGRYWDGAVGGYNNPSLAGITEALANDISLDDIRLLSIGTGNLLLPPKPAQSNSKKNNLKPFFSNNDKGEGMFTAIKMMSTSIIAEPPDSASYTSFLLLDCLKRKNVNCYIRMNPVISPEINEKGEWDYPGIYNKSHDEFDKLLKMEMDAYLEEDFKLICKLTEHWLSDLIPNQAIRVNSSLQPLIDQKSGYSYGHGFFSKALNDLDWIN